MAGAGAGLSVVDMHTAGEPVRIVVGGFPDLTGRTILDKRREADELYDHLRRRMVLEPRGHAGMYGVIPTAPCHPEADLAVLFTHADGYSTMCGHATIAVARWALDSGIVRKSSSIGTFKLECPCGLVKVFAEHGPGGAILSGFESVPAFAASEPQMIDVAGHGPLPIDIAYGGAYYAILPAAAVGLSFDRCPTRLLSSAAARILDEIRGRVRLPSCGEPELEFLYGVILCDDSPWPGPSRNLCVFAAGQIDRSPTGGGVTARIALDIERKRAALGVARSFAGPTGEPFQAAAIRKVRKDGRDSVVVRVSGRAFYTGSGHFTVEPDDPLADGFLLGQEANA